jgi:hypothetical protein
MEARFPPPLGLEKLLSHSGDNKPINGQKDIKWKAKRHGEPDKADQDPEKNLLALERGETVKKVREKNREDQDG